MSKRNKIIYWISTLWLCLGMTATGLVQLFKLPAEGQVSPPGVYGITYLGYPVSIAFVIGTNGGLLVFQACRQKTRVGWQSLNPAVSVFLSFSSEK